MAVPTDTDSGNNKTSCHLRQQSHNANNFDLQMRCRNSYGYV